jgi:hypothetical protein
MQHNVLLQGSGFKIDYSNRKNTAEILSLNIIKTIQRGGVTFYAETSSMIFKREIIIAIIANILSMIADRMTQTLINLLHS